MKLLFVNTLYAPNVVGGAERSTQWLAEAFAQQGNEVSVATLSREGRLTSEILNQVQVHRLPLANLYWPWDGKKHTGSPLWHLRDIDNPTMGRRFGQLLEDIRPDVVHTNSLAGFSVSVWRSCARRGIPIIHTQRDYYLLCGNSSMFRRGRNCDGPCVRCRLFQLRKRELSSLVSGVVGNSQYILETHAQQGFFPSAKFQRVIWSAYRAPDDASVLPSRTEVQPLRLGFFGRQTPEKGIELLLAAGAKLAEKVEVMIAGAGDEDYVNGLRSRYPGATFLGLQRPADFFRKIDVLVVPSLWHEPLARVVIEANVHGVPVIATDRGGSPELIRPGVNGFLFDPDFPEQLDAAIKAFLDEPALKVRLRAGCLAMAEHFKPAQVAASYLSAYEDVLAA
ncbi:MAG: glycosyltransferase family 4 protein [Chthoniobacter sp.]|nr:glycosyltransferase family 4 protein [Chthoniobacter sp.]